jgi:hypothetical protein
MSTNSFIDLNFIFHKCHTPAKTCKEMANEFRENDILSTDEFSTRLRVPTMSGTLQRKLQNKKLLMLGSVPLHGFRSTHLPREPERHPSMPTCNKSKNVSHGHSWKGLSQYACACQSGSRLAHLRGLRTSAYQESQSSLCQRLLRCRTGSNCLRARCHNDRSLPYAFSLGGVPKTQRRGKTTYASRFARKHPHNDLRYARQDSRGQYPGRNTDRSRSLLYRGSRLSRFCQALQGTSISSILRNPGQEQLPLQAPLFSECRQGDQIVSLVGHYVKKDYPERIRRLRFYDAPQNRRLVFLTNNFNLPALTITELYQRRWQIELFFKWIKQHLRIKAFYGTSENAVKTQIWIAISIYVLVAIVKKQLKLDRSLYSILQILSITIFEKMPILQALTTIDVKEQNTDFENQLNLFS